MGFILLGLSEVDMNNCRKCIHFEDVKILGIEKCHTKFGRYIEQGHSMDNAVLLNARELDIMLDTARADERAKVIEECLNILKTYLPRGITYQIVKGEVEQLKEQNNEL
jgi:hypothetical protein